MSLFEDSLAGGRLTVACENLRAFCLTAINGVSSEVAATVSLECDRPESRTTAIALNLNDHGNAPLPHHAELQLRATHSEIDPLMKEIHRAVTRYAPTLGSALGIWQLVVHRIPGPVRLDIHIGLFILSDLQSPWDETADHGNRARDILQRLEVLAEHLRYTPPGHAAFVIHRRVVKARNVLEARHIASAIHGRKKNRPEAPGGTETPAGKRKIPKPYQPHKPGKFGIIGHHFPFAPALRGSKGSKTKLKKSERFKPCPSTQCLSVPVKPSMS